MNEKKRRRKEYENYFFNIKIMSIYSKILISENIFNLIIFYRNSEKEEIKAKRVTII